MDWNALLQQVIASAVPLLVQAAVAAVSVLIPTLLALGTKFLVHKIEESKTGKDNYFAGIAVKAIEDQMQGAKGEEKLAAAVKMLISLSKGTISDDKANALVRASYQSVMGEASGLKNG